MSDALARLFYSPLHYAGAVVLALVLALALSIRNEGWLPPFRQWRIRRVLLLALLGWGLAVLSHAATASVAPQAVPISALHTPPLGVGRPPAASRALLSTARGIPMSTTADLFEGVFDNRATNRREIWQGGRLCRFVRRDCVGHTGSVWKEVHAPWGSYPDLPSNAAAVAAA